MTRSPSPSPGGKPPLPLPSNSTFSGVAGSGPLREGLPSSPTAASALAEGRSRVNPLRNELPPTTLRALLRCSYLSQKITFGLPGTLQFRLVFLDRDKETSPWKTVPLYFPLGTNGEIRGLTRVICTTPAGSRICYEFAQHEPFHPVRVARTSEGQPLRFTSYAHWNLGLLPQTFADPAQPAIYPPPPLNGKHHDAGAGEMRNDGLPIEVVDLAMGTRQTGDMYLLKPLGALAMVGAYDRVLSWKVIGVAADHRLADELHDVGDLDRVLPGLMMCILEWLKCRMVPAEGEAKRVQVSGFTAGEGMTRGVGVKVSLTVL